MHCNNLTALLLTKESRKEVSERSLRVLPYGVLTNLALIPTIREDIMIAQKKDVGIQHIKRRLKIEKVKCFREDDEGVIWFKNRLVVPKDFALRKRILDEAHTSKYSIHPEQTKCIKT